MQRVYGWAEQGNKTVLTNGVVSQNNTLVQRSFPGATVTVFISGTNNTANLFSDNNGSVLANPFVAGSSGYWDFYAAAGRYDIQFSGNNVGIPSPFTLPDVLVGAVQNINNQSGANLTLLVGNSGNNFNISANNNNITLNLPAANANNNGYLAASDWSNFNGKSQNLSFTSPLVNNNGNVSITLPLTVAQGGTNGITAVQAFDNLSPQTTKGDLIAFDGNNSVRLPVGANNNYVLLVDSNAADGMRWGPVPLGAGNGIVPVVNGGTGANNNTAAFANLAPISTKGDIITANNTNVPVRLGVGSNGQVLTSDATQPNGLSWQNQNLAGPGFTNILPIANGGTGGNNAAQAFNGLSPMNTNGDLITRAGNTATRLGIGNQNDVLSVNNNNVAVWRQPSYLTTHMTVAFNNAAFLVNSNATDVTLFTLGQYQKVAGLTVKPSTLFLNNNNTITDIQVAVGVGGNSNFFSNNYSVGNNGVIGNSNFQDTALFKSANMGGNQSVLARFTAANGNFGNGANTVLLSGSVDIWVTIVNLQ